MAAYVFLAPPLFLLGPLVLLVLFSKPSSAREWIWLALTLFASAYWLRAGSGLGDQVLRAAGVFVTVAFVILSLTLRRPLFTRAAMAALIGALALVGWAAALGLTLAQFERAILDQMVATYQALLASSPGDARTRQDASAFLQALIAGAPGVARVYPGIVALQSLAGTALAWVWYHRIASRPIGEPPGRFRDFRFNDHLVWGAIFTLGLMLAPLPQAVTNVSLNLLVVWVGLYAVRGLAVLGFVFAAWAGPLKFLAGLLAIPLAPLALGILLALGLADTWLDIRGRLARAASGGTQR